MSASTSTITINDSSVLAASSAVAAPKEFEGKYLYQTAQKYPIINPKRAINALGIMMTVKAVDDEKYIIKPKLVVMNQTGTGFMESVSINDKQYNNYIAPDRTIRILRKKLRRSSQFGLSRRDVKNLLRGIPKI